MKKNLLLTLLVLLSFSFMHGRVMVEFRAAVEKPFPGQPEHVKLLKTAAEIPAFKAAADEDKKEWDKLVAQINDMAKMEIAEEEKIKKHPTVQKYQKLVETSSAKSKQLKKAVDEMVKDNPKIKKFTAEIKALEEKLKPLKKQQEELNKKTSQIFEKKWSLMEDINNIRKEAKKDFPKNLKKLDAEVAELRKQHSILFKEYLKVRKEKIKKIDFGKVFDFGKRMRELFKKMTKKKRV